MLSSIFHKELSAFLEIQKSLCLLFEIVNQRNCNVILANENLFHGSFSLLDFHSLYTEVSKYLYYVIL